MMQFKESSGIKKIDMDYVKETEQVERFRWEALKVQDVIMCNEKGWLLNYMG